jgi:hypothetical protein
MKSNPNPDTSKVIFRVVIALKLMLDEFAIKGQLPSVLVTFDKGSLPDGWKAVKEGDGWVFALRS